MKPTPSECRLTYAVNIPKELKDVAKLNADGNIVLSGNGKNIKANTYKFTVTTKTPKGVVLTKATYDISIVIAAAISRGPGDIVATLGPVTGAITNAAVASRAGASARMGRPRPSLPSRTGPSPPPSGGAGGKSAGPGPKGDGKPSGGAKGGKSFDGGKADAGANTGGSVEVGGDASSGGETSFDTETGSGGESSVEVESGGEETDFDGGEFSGGVDLQFDTSNQADSFDFSI